MKLKLITLFIIYAIFFCETGVFSANRVDSLNAQLKNTFEIEGKILIYIELASEYREINLDSSLIYINKALDLSNESGFTNEFGEIYGTLGDISVMRDDLDKAIHYYNTSLTYLESEEDLYDKTMVFMVLGNLYLVSDNIKEAMQYYMDGLRIADENDFKKVIPALSNNLGIIYLESEEIDKALKHFEEAYRISKELNNSIVMAEILHGLGQVYYTMEQFDMAFDYFNQSRDIFTSFNNHMGVIQCQINIANIERQLGYYKVSLKYLDSSMLMLEKNYLSYLGPRITILSDIKLSQALAYLGLNDLKNAEKLLKSSYNLSLQSNQLKTTVTSADKLVELFAIKNEPDSALYYFLKFKEYSELLDNEKSVRTTELMGMQFAYDKRIQEQEMEISLQEAAQKRLNLIYVFISGGLLLSLIIVGLFLKLENNKKKSIQVAKKSLENELEFRNKELTTHVMYLMSKNEFIMNLSEKIKKAKLNPKPDHNQILNELVSELETNTVNVSWEEFEIRFQKVHVDFYRILNEKYPDLTPNELRICAFLRLNMTTKEIASITYQSLKSIDTARYRLRKKLGIDQDKNLVSFLQQI